MATLTNGQYTDIGAPTQETSGFTEWTFNPGILIDPTMVEGGAKAYLVYLRFLHTPGIGENYEVRLQTASTPDGSGTPGGPDLISAWENFVAALSVRLGSQEWVIHGPGLSGFWNPATDTTEPYEWNPRTGSGAHGGLGHGGGADINEFGAQYPGLSGKADTELRLWDGTVVLPSVKSKITTGALRVSATPERADSVPNFSTRITTGGLRITTPLVEGVTKTDNVSTKITTGALRVSATAESRLVIPVSILEEAREEEYVPLIEIEFDSGTRRYSFAGVSTQRGWYSDKVLRIGRVSREVSLLPEGARIASTHLNLADFPDREFSILKDKEAFRGRTVRFYLGTVSGDISPIFTGTITSYRFSKGVLDLEVRDPIFDRFRVEVTGRMNGVTDFPDLPEDQDLDLYPIGYGNLTGSDLGTVPAIRTTALLPEGTETATTPAKYLLFRHPCQSVERVYVDGIVRASGWTAPIETIAGQRMQILQLTPDPGNDAVVTADVKGKVDDNGNLIENPVEVLRDFVTSYCHTTVDEFDSEIYEASRALAIRSGYKTSMWIGGNRRVCIDEVNTLCECFVMSFFVTRGGKFAPGILTYESFFNADGTARAPDVQEFTDQEDVIKNSFRVESNFRYAASSAHYLYSPRWPSGKYEKALTQSSGVEIRNLGEDLSSRLNLPYIRDTETANRTTSVKLLIGREDQQIVSFDIPVVNSDQELNDEVLLTHYQGISAGGQGYRKTPLRILELDLQLRPTQAKISASAARISDRTGHFDTHVDVHTDGVDPTTPHQNISHSDTGHIDSHTNSGHDDSPHQNHTDSVRTHRDNHTDTPAVAHFDFSPLYLSDNKSGHADQPAVRTGHSDTDTTTTRRNVPHGNSAHSDHTNRTAHGDIAHSDVAEVIGHSDTLHEDFHSDTERTHTNTGGTSHDDIHHSDS